MKNCENCKHYYEIEKVTPFPGGAEVTFLDGYACTSRAEKDDKVRWFVNLDKKTYCCDSFIPKK